MTREDIDDLFELLKLYFPNSPKTRDQMLKSAWFLVLEPYGRPDVKQAILSFLRKNEHFPDPQKIACLCHLNTEDTRREIKMQFSPAEVEDMKKLWAAWDKVVAMRRDAGIPGTCLEAKQAGLSDKEWYAMLENAGLEFSVGRPGLVPVSGREAAGL